MTEYSLKNPWAFTSLVILVWVLVWGSIEFLIFGINLLNAVIMGSVIGLVFGLSYVGVSYYRAE